MVTNVQVSEQLLELVGIVGFVFYMLAYGLLQLGKISSQCYSFTLINMLAAFLVLISLTNQFNLASALIQVSWIAISIVGVFRIWSTGRRRKIKRRCLTYQSLR